MFRSKIIGDFSPFEVYMSSNNQNQCDVHIAEIRNFSQFKDALVKAEKLGQQNKQLNHIHLDSQSVLHTPIDVFIENNKPIDIGYFVKRIKDSAKLYDITPKTPKDTETTSLFNYLNNARQRIDQHERTIFILEWLEKEWQNDPERKLS